MLESDSYCISLHSNFVPCHSVISTVQKYKLIQLKYFYEYSLDICEVHYYRRSSSCFCFMKNLFLSRSATHLQKTIPERYVFTLGIVDFWLFVCFLVYFFPCFGLEQIKLNPVCLISGHYVVIHLLKENEMVRVQETKAQTGYCPIWNQPFLFDLGTEAETTHSIDFLIMRKKLHTKDAVVGHVTIGENSCRSGRHHWKEIMSPRPLESAKWHAIMPVLNLEPYKNMNLED